MALEANVTKEIQKIEWDDSYDMNISTIDEEHKKFIKTVNKVISIAEQIDNDTHEITYVLYEMTMYALSHFKTEEDYMRKFEYSEYRLHEEEHNEFIKKTVEFCDRTKNGDYDITNDLLEFLQSWLVNHIQGTDKKLIKCFNKHI